MGDSRRCLTEEVRRAEQALRVELAAARAEAADTADLAQVQRIWMRYRDRQCRAAGAQFEGGTLQPVAILRCIRDVTCARVSDLWEAYLSDTERPRPPCPGQGS